MSVSMSCAKGQCEDGNGFNLGPEVTETIRMQQTAAKAKKSSRARREPRRRRNSLRGWLSCCLCVGSTEMGRMVVVRVRNERVEV